MKPIKSGLLLMLMTLFVVCGMYAQEEKKEEEKKYQMYSVHEDRVMPSKVMQYEQTAKMLADKMREHKISEGSYLATNTDNFRYLYISPIENMADLDQNPGMGELYDKMGEEAFGKMMDQFDGTYDKHGDYVIWMDKELCYMPDGITQTPEGQNFRKFWYLYFKPGDGAALRDAMKDVKEMFASKGSQSYYRVYRSGFGNMDSFFMVAAAAKDATEMEKGGAANDELLGEGAQAVFGKVLSHVTKMEEYTGYIRPELGYSANQN